MCRRMYALWNATVPARDSLLVAAVRIVLKTERVFIEGNMPQMWLPNERDKFFASLRVARSQGLGYM